MRKPFLLSLLVALLTTLSTHAYNFQSGDLYYNITSDNTVEVTYQEIYSLNNYQGLTTATIPETVIYNGTTYSVTSIGDDAFENCYSLTSITIPNSVTSIGIWAFFYCSSLTSITIPNSVTSIGESAFENVPNIVFSGTATGSPWGARSVNGYVEGYLVYADETKTTLLACSAAATGEVTLPNSVTSIGEWAFYKCSSLTSVTIPNSVTSIGKGAFSGCSSLTSITIGNSVTSIGDNAFEYCSSLASIILPNSVTTIGGNAFSGCSALTSITLPNSVTSIGNAAFYHCSALTSITIPNSVTSIGDWAFRGCSALTSITIGNSVTSIGKQAFRDCSSLTSITIPNSVTSIGENAFYRCSSLTSITIPNSVTSIGEQAFYDCSSLTSITIPNSVTSIGEYAFKDVLNIVYSGTATGSPWGARSVNGYVEGYLVYADETKTTLLACSAATTGEVTLPNSVTSIEQRAFFNCSSLTSITIGNSVTSIGENAFYRCSSLTSITIGNSVTSIGDYAFGGCSSLTSITIGNSVTSIGNYAFSSCSSITSITIPNSVTSIGNGAFSSCSSITSITCLATTPPTCGWNPFYGVPRTIPLYVPAESVEAYKAADTWKEFDVQALSTDATLSSLTYDGMLVPFFDAGTLHYTVDLPSETSTLPQVDAVANDLGAQITIHQATTLPGEASVEVLAADNTTRQTYTIYFSKKSTPTDISDRPDTTGTDSDKGVKKLLRNGQVLIIRNGKTYNMMGQRL